MAETYKQRIARENREHAEKVARAAKQERDRQVGETPPELPKETD